MTTLDEVLQIQKDSQVLQAPTEASSASAAEISAQTSSTVSVALRNNTSSSNAYAYISGLDSDNNNAVFLLQSDGSTVYHPTSPSTILQPLAVNCAIALGAPGNTVTVTIPRTAGGRIWLSKDSTLTFRLNPGPALVEPSVTNTSDPNYNVYWDFCEFTFNSYQLFVNITYVDFVCLPIALQLQNTSGLVTTVKGIPSTGLDTICSALRTQDNSDGAGWSKLIVTSSSGANLRALSPNSGITMNKELFNGYYQPYVSQVWTKYATDKLSVNTQASWGLVTGNVDSSVSKLAFGSVGAFPQPSAADIFSCSTGAFSSYANNTDEMANISARLAAAFNRSTLLVNPVQPDNEVVSTYYTNAITNHYARIVHATNMDGIGYAFPYDDVSPSTTTDQSGALYDPNPQLLTVMLGGLSSSSKVRLRDMARGGRQIPHRGGRRTQRVRRDLDWASAEDKKQAMAAFYAREERGEEGNEGSGSNGSEEADLEMGIGRGKLSEHLETGRPSSSSSLMTSPLISLVPPAWAARAQACLARLEEGTLYAKTKPVVDVVVRLVAAFLSLSVRALISRVTMVLFLFIFYLVVPLFRASGDAGRGDVAHAASMVMADSVNVTSTTFFPVD